MNYDILENYDFSDAYVVFEDNTNLWWLKFLKKGYRHCYILLRLQNTNLWLEINPMSNQLFLLLHADSLELDYISYLKNKKLSTVLEIEIQDAPIKCAPIGFFTCVELVKRIIGIHSFFTITPYQLMNKIKKCRKKVLTNEDFFDKP